MTPIFLDYETYWSQDHSLSKMNPIAYVMDPRTEIQSVAIKEGLKGKTHIIFGYEEILKHYETIDWEDSWCIAHNMSEFDSMIHSWRMGVSPKFWGCTLAMARPRYAMDVGVSLKALMTALDCPYQKGSLEDVNTKGKYLADFTDEELAKMREYNGIDTDGCAFIFSKLVRRTNPLELELIDLTIRMLVQPSFDCDTPLLQATLEKEQSRKNSALLDIATITGAYKVGMDEEEATEAVKKTLGSGAKFAEFLKSLGVEAPMKPSPSNPNKQTYALAKTDPEFIALQEHKDPLVALAAQTRLGVKSTLLETRIGKFLETSSLFDRKLPVPLRYWGANTGRWSGWIYNPQNLPRIGKEPKATDALRYSMKAPKGYKVVVADLSGIELRINMFLWKVQYAMDMFTADPAKADLYKVQASRAFDVPFDEVTKDQRQAGKAIQLGSGFGLGSAEKFSFVAKQLAGIVVDLETSAHFIATYRQDHPEIVTGWKTCHRSLEQIYLNNKYFIDPWEMCYTTKEGIVTPVGTIHYPALHTEAVLDDKGEDTGKTEWVYGVGRNRSRIYAGKVDENLVQHLARGIIAGNALTVKKNTGYRPANMVHDELIYIVPNEEAEDMLDEVQSVMRTPPVWWPELAVWSEGELGDSYGACK